MAPRPALDRRAFLRRGLQLGAYAAGAVVSSAALEGCAHSSTPTTTTSMSLGPPRASEWSALAASLTGTLVRPSNATYAQDRLLYNAKFVDLHPLAIAYCASADDVARCLDFTNRHDLAVAARSGGHSYAGYSSCDGLVVDVSRLKSISLDLRANTAVVGAGAQLIDVYNVLGAHGRLLPGGSCPTVGIAGLTLGGGVGVFARRYGLTSDNLRSLKLVSAAAEHLSADDQRHSDLLWACRGGGGGNFGIATSFEFQVHPMPEVTLFTLQYPWSAAAAMLHGWQRWIESMPDELWSNCLLLAEGPAGYLAQVSGVFCGTTNELSSLLASLTPAIGSKATDTFVGSNPYIQAMMIEAGCSGLSVAACHMAGQTPGGTLGREAYSAKSSYVDLAMDESRSALMVAAVENLKDRAPALGGGLAFDAYGGAINRLASDRTAFVHRDKLACIQATYSWSAQTPQSLIDAGRSWLTWLGRDVFDPATGAYQNYIDPTLADWREAYYGANLARLVKVKRTYDPEDVFHFAQSIPRRLS
jgi:FAD binding domain/Berberine and berberine like